MANPHAGEVAVWIDGRRHAAKLTLGALAALEADLRADSLVALIGRFEGRAFSASDVIAVLVAGLRAGGWTGEAEDLMTADLRGGPMEGARAAAELLARAFAGPA